MHERLLYDVLKAGVGLMSSDLEMLEDLYSRELGLAEEEVEAIRTFWTDKTPTVHHSYPRRDFQTPFYSIALGLEEETEHVLGDDAGMISDPDDPSYGDECKTSFWQHRYQIFCVTEHPDATLYIYQAAKYLYGAVHEEIAAAGFYEFHMSGGELEPDPRYMPEHWFVRQLTLSFKSEFVRLDRAAALGKAWKVAGIHIDREGAPGEDTGDVKTLVYPVTAEE
jgi:hypothetical protein